jgi:hypothetical protein
MKNMTCQQLKSTLISIKELHQQITALIAAKESNSLKELMRLSTELKPKLEVIKEELSYIPKKENFSISIVKDAVVTEKNLPNRRAVRKKILELAPMDGIYAEKLKIEHELVDQSGSLIGLFVAIPLSKSKSDLMKMKHDWYIYKAKHSSQELGTDAAHTEIRRADTNGIASLVDVVRTEYVNGAWEHRS